MTQHNVFGSLVSSYFTIHSLGPALWLPESKRKGNNLILTSFGYQINSSLETSNNFESVNFVCFKFLKVLNYEIPPLATHSSMVSSGMWVGTCSCPVSRQSTMPCPQRQPRGHTGERVQWRGEDEDTKPKQTRDFFELDNEIRENNYQQIQYV